LAWDEKYLVRATVALGSLASIDPGGQWANRPNNSLTTIFLPWLPQTMGSIEKRKVAIQTLMKDFPEVGWKLLLTLLPGQVQASGYTHKPTWRKVVPKDWKGVISQKDYWSQVSIYAEMAIEAAQADLTKLRQLIENLDHLPRPLFERLLAHVQSDAIAGKPEDEKLGIWTSLVELAIKHRRFAGAEWALPPEAVSQIEEAARSLSR
jgi:hypothetical protein